MIASIIFCSDLFFCLGALMMFVAALFCLRFLRKNAKKAAAARWNDELNWIGGHDAHGDDKLTFEAKDGIIGGLDVNTTLAGPIIVGGTLDVQLPDSKKDHDRD